MADTVILRGFTATAPQLRTLPTGVPAVNFRLASTPRWFDAATNSWREGHTSWYTVCAYRKLAQNIATSLTVGCPVLLTGRLRTQQWQREDGSQGASIEVDASSIGLDLTYGTSTFSRTVERQGSQSNTKNTANTCQADVSQHELGASSDTRRFQEHTSRTENTAQEASSEPQNMHNTQEFTGSMQSSNYQEQTTQTSDTAPF